MAFQHVILALLESGPSHGWEMKARIEAALGPEYGGLNKGYIYEVIHKMEREGHNHLEGGVTGWHAPGPERARDHRDGP